MSKTITVQDCLVLQDRFSKYTESAEQHQFPMLFMIDIMMQKTVDKILKQGSVQNQKDTRAMFRSVLRVIGEDYSEYEEQEEESP